MNHLDKYLLVKQAGITDWLPDQTFETSASDGIGSDVGNFFKGIGNVFADPITGLFSGDPKKMLGSAALAGLTFVPGGRAVSGAGKAGLTTVQGLSTVGKNSGIHALKQGVGFKDALANSYKFWKPGWAKGMAHGYTRPLNATIMAGAGGLNSYLGRNIQPGGEQGQGPLGDFNPAALAPIGMALASLLRKPGLADSLAGRINSLNARISRDGLQTERMGAQAF